MPQFEKVYYQREVAGNKYYWNDIKKQWEGLLDNGTKVGRQRFDYLTLQFKKSEIHYIFESKQYKL